MCARPGWGGNGGDGFAGTKSLPAVTRTSHTWTVVADTLRQVP